MAKQLTFDLPLRTARGREAFFAAPSNHLALAMIDAWPEWPEGRLFIKGPAGSGKTHLVAVWAEAAHAEIISAEQLSTDMIPGLTTTPLAVENIHGLASDQEHALFHLLNLMRAEGQSVLLTSRNGADTIALPDLRSRIAAVTQLELGVPDDALLAALLVKFFADRQISVAPNLIPYLLRRVERSAEALEQVVRQLDAAGLARQAPLTRRLARQVLEDETP